MEYRYNGEKVNKISAQISDDEKHKENKDAIDGCEILRIEYLRKQGNMVQDIRTESGKIVHNVHLRVLEIIE